MNEESLASRRPTEPANSLSAGNLETLEYLHRAIELTDAFALLFARCDQPAQRDALIARLGERLARQGRFGYRQDVVPPTTGLLAALQTVCQATFELVAPACVHICGLEDALPPDDPHPPVLGQLNLARDRFRELHCPLVFWLPDAALTRLAQGAPDFWAWRSGTFDFEPRWAPPEDQPQEPERAQVEERILVMENLLNDYRTLPDGPTEQRARAGLLVDLANLYRLTSRPRTARQRLREARPLVRRLRDNSLKSRSQDILRSLDAGPEAKDV